MTELSAGVWVEELEESPVLTRFLDGLKTAFSQGFVRFQPSGQVMPRCFTRMEKAVSEMEVREDDVWIASFPKCGTTWTQEMVWNIMHGVDLEAAKATSLEKRVPFLELSGLLEDQFLADMDIPDSLKSDSTDTKSSSGLQVAGFSAESLMMVEEQESPRIIKTHLSLEMLPRQVLEKQAKVIYVTRNPRDAIVSYFNHWRVLAGYTGTLSTLVDAFIAGVAGYNSPFLQHVLSYWNQRHEKHLLFLTYEEMKSDLAGVVSRVATFLGKTLSPKQTADLLEHLSFNNMKANSAVNKDDFLESVSAKTGMEKGQFLRKGEVGDWRNHLTEEQVSRMAAWEEEGLAGSGFKFVHNL